MAYFHCLIGGGSSGGGYELTVTCDADFSGTTITCTDGVTTLTQTCPSSSPYEVVFAIPNGGEWTISGIVSGQTYSESIDIPDSLELHSVPEGSTVLPTDDIQTWLACAGITDKAYTTLAEVLADSTTLLALMSNNNAVDYLVRSKTWTGCKVPTMTGNTSPSGECISNVADSSSYYKYYAFDQNTSTAWAGAQTGNSYIGYKFTQQVVANKAYFKVGNYYGRITSIKVQGSNDNFDSDIHDLSESITPTSDETTINLSSVGFYQYYRLYMSVNAAPIIYEVQFYSDGITSDSTAMTDIGANNYCANTLLSDSTWLDAICNSTYFESVLNIKVPTMTGYTTPSGEVIYSDRPSGSYEGWKAFDGNTTTLWRKNTASPSYVGYDFSNDVNIFYIQLNHIEGSSIKFQGYGESDWEDIDDTIIADNGIKTYNISALNSYQKYRLLNATTLYEGQFYGRNASS